MKLRAAEDEADDLENVRVSAWRQQSCLASARALLAGAHVVGDELIAVDLIRGLDLGQRLLDLLRLRDASGERLALLLVWSSAEPHRAGEVAVPLTARNTLQSFAT